MNDRLPSLVYADQYVSRILSDTKTIAMVGASPKPARPSWQVMEFLQSVGYRVIPVNPGLAGSDILGEQVYGNLAEVPEPFQMVDIFRQSSEVAAIVDDVLALAPVRGIKTIWTQLNIRDDHAAGRATAAGLNVVMDRCPKIEYLRLFG